MIDFLDKYYYLKHLHLTRRFAAMAGVARRTIKWEIHRYCLVASVLSPATAASRWDVSSKWRATVHQNTVKQKLATTKGKTCEAVRAGKKLKSV
jgi:hypothetical protein